MQDYHIDQGVSVKGTPFLLRCVCCPDGWQICATAIALLVIIPIVILMASLFTSDTEISQVSVALAANLLVALLMAMMLSWFYLFVLDGGVAANHNQQVPVYLAGTILLIVIVSMLWSLRSSRAVAGMIKKLENVLTDAGNGAFPDSPLIFRKGDHFTSLSIPINKCIAQLQERDTSREVTVSAISSLVDKIDDEGMSTGEVVNILKGLMVQLK